MPTRDVTDLQVMTAAFVAPRRGLRTLEVLVEQTGQPQKVCVRAIERAIRRGLLDCGVSVASSFLTDAGRSALHASTGSGVLNA